MTRRQSNNQWRGGIAGNPTPKFSSSKICWKISLFDFLGWSGILLIDYFPTGRTINSEYYSSLPVQLKDKGKRPREGHQGGSCSCTTMPRLTGHLQPRRNWPTWVSNILITHSILRIWPRRTTTCSLDWKNNRKVAIFRQTRRLFLPRRPGWTDKLLNFFFLSGLQKLEQRAKKCIELRGGVCWINPEFGRCSLFPSWSG